MTFGWPKTCIRGGHRALWSRAVSFRAGGSLMDWGFVVFVGTMLFFAAIHQWPPDGRRWERKELERKDD